jgi:hypothetical protein
VGEFFDFTVTRIYATHTQHVIFQNLEAAQAYATRHMYDPDMQRIEITCFSCHLGEIKVMSSPRLEMPT